MNADGTKLSKRQGDIKISHYRENNIFPLALLNFIVHSGGGFSKDLERHLKPKCYSIEELVNQVFVKFVVSFLKISSCRLINYKRRYVRQIIDLPKEKCVLIKNKNR